MPLSVVIVLGRRAGETLAFDGREEAVCLGSDPEAGAHLPDARVAPEHAWFVPYANGWEVVAASGRTLRVNGVERERAWLGIDDHLAVGRAVLRVDATTTAEDVRVLPSELRALAGVHRGGAYRLGRGGTLGRGVGATIPLLDIRCSRTHCRIERRREGYLLFDEGATNGTWLNEQRIKPGTAYRLEPGDRIGAGRTLFELHVVAEERPTPLPPGTEEAAGPRADRLQQAPTYRLDPDGPALVGTLDRLGFGDLVQFLHMSRKTGELLLEGPAGECGIAFRAGDVVDAWSPYGGSAEETFFSIARFRAARFTFHEGVAPRAERIERPTQALLMEAMRLVDEETDVGAV